MPNCYKTQHFFVRRPPKQVITDGKPKLAGGSGAMRLSDLPRSRELLPTCHGLQPLEALALTIGSQIRPTTQAANVSRL